MDFMGIGHHKDLDNRHKKIESLTYDNMKPYTIYLRLIHALRPRKHRSHSVGMTHNNTSDEESAAPSRMTSSKLERPTKEVSLFDRTLLLVEEEDEADNDESKDNDKEGSGILKPPSPDKATTDETSHSLSLSEQHTGRSTDIFTISEETSLRKDNPLLISESHKDDSSSNSTPLPDLVTDGIADNFGGKPLTEVPLPTEDGRVIERISEKVHHLLPQRSRYSIGKDEEEDKPDEDIQQQVTLLVCSYRLGAPGLMFLLSLMIILAILHCHATERKLSRLLVT
jgi:hypothetical protein